MSTRRPAPVAARWPDILLTIAGGAGIAVVFLPFTGGTVPLTDVILDDIAYRDWQLWLMVLPCVMLPFVITTAQITQLAGGWPQRLSAVAFAAAALVSLLYLACVVQDMAEYQWTVVAALSAAAYGAGGWLSLRVMSPGSGGLAALQVAYLVPMSFWLGFAGDDVEIGAWLGAVTSLAYMAQLGRAASRPAAVLAVAAPLVVLLVYVLSVD